MRSKYTLAPLILIIVIISSFATCRRKPPSLEAIDTIDRRSNVPMVEPISQDLAEIRKRGSLTVLAPYNSTTYFIYQGEPLGYEYELLQAFAKDLGVPLKMVVVTDQKSLLPLLNSGEGDIAASRLIPTPDIKTDVSFTHALYHTEPVLVQQGEPPSEAGKGSEKALKPGPADQMPEVDIQARLITKPSQLAGRTVDLPEQSPYHRTLMELSDEISGEIYVVEVGGKIQDETLAQKVARGEVQFTVMQKNLAELKEAEFKNLRVRPILGETQSVSWAVRKNSPDLLATLNSWIAEKKNTPIFDRLYQKYFIDRRHYLERVTSEYLTSTTGKLSEFDLLIKQSAAELNWDWRLLASKVLHRAERNLPANLSFAKVYSSEQAPWGSSARQARRRLQEATKQAVRCTGLGRILAVFRAGIAPRKICAGNEFYFRDEVICIDDQKAVMWIESVATPGHSAQVSRHDEGPLKAWRREYAFVAKSPDPGEAGVAILLGRTPGILRG